METHALLFCLGIMERIENEKDSRGLDSDCRKTSTCDGRYGRIRTRIGAFKYFTESLSSLLSTDPSAHPYLFGVVQNRLFAPRCFLPMMLRHLILAQWAVYHVESIMDAS